MRFHLLTPFIVGVFVTALCGAILFGLFVVWRTADARQGKAPNPFCRNPRCTQLRLEDSPFCASCLAIEQDRLEALFAESIQKPDRP